MGQLGIGSTVGVGGLPGQLGSALRAVDLGIAALHCALCSCVLGFAESVSLVAALRCFVMASSCTTAEMFGFDSHKLISSKDRHAIANV